MSGSSSSVTSTAGILPLAVAEGCVLDPTVLVRDWTSRMPVVSFDIRSWLSSFDLASSRLKGRRPFGQNIDSLLEGVKIALLHGLACAVGVATLAFGHKVVGDGNLYTQIARTMEAGSGETFVGLVGSDFVDREVVILGMVEPFSVGRQSRRIDLGHVLCWLLGQAGSPLFAQVGIALLRQVDGVVEEQAECEKQDNVQANIASRLGGLGSLMVMDLGVGWILENMRERRMSGLDEASKEEEKAALDSQNKS
ncbi:hypothetical protein CC86DRAFT_431868 [Ophiobolus disseminans]|uniref:Uncharacterized protein n=1 Tax=Ophiobolus disseminans TaxID=1469910 RepID=A0A6A6ZE66_9PLEO|nr:hypothetical protein CC86DRAFT_431868 [Ophiobolus disseminans]